MVWTLFYAPTLSFSSNGGIVTTKSGEIWVYLFGVFLLDTS